jgi:hypothetical protein
LAAFYAQICGVKFEFGAFSLLGCEIIGRGSCYSLLSNASEELTAYRIYFDSMRDTEFLWTNFMYGSRHNITTTASHSMRAKSPPSIVFFIFNHRYNNHNHKEQTLHQVRR